MAKSPIPILFLLVLSVHSFAQGGLNRALLSHAKEAPEFSVEQIDLLLQYLLTPTSTDRERAEVLAYWVATHLVYDTEAYEQNIIKEEPWKETYTNRIAACSGYSQLYKALCDRAGVDCWVIEGYAKSIDYRQGMRFSDTNHAWNVVLVDGQYYPLDITWASGVLKRKWNHRLVFEPYFDASHLFSPPWRFVEKHLAAQPRWQLLMHPVSMTDYLEWIQPKDMIDQDSPEFYYPDSIAAFLTLEKYERKVKDLRDAMYFHRSDVLLANGYYQLAYSYAMEELYSEDYLEQSLYYFQKAKDLYMRPHVNNENMIGHCDRGIQFGSVRLHNLRARKD